MSKTNIHKSAATPEQGTIKISKKTRNALVLSLGGIIAVLVTVIIVILISVNQPAQTNNSAGQNTVEQTTQSPVNQSGELDPNEVTAHKAAARNAAIEMLEAALESPTGEDINTRVAKLDDKDSSVINEKVLEYIRLEDLVAGDEDLRMNTLQSVIVLADTMDKAGGIGKVDEGVSTSLVYLDTGAGVAYVPMSSLSKYALPFSLEMVYVEGKWQLSPYPLLDMVRLSAMAQGINPTTGK